MKFITPYNYDDERNIAFATSNLGPTMTQQSDANEADINVIMARFGQGGTVPQVIEPGKYGDFSEAVDFRRAQDIIKEAQDAFLEVPANIRKRFDNDPAEFFQFANNPDNVDELVKLGLAVPKPQPDPTPPDPVVFRYDDNGPVPSPLPQETNDNGQPPRTRDDRPPVPAAPRPSGQPRGR